MTKDTERELTLADLKQYASLHATFTSCHRRAKFEVMLDEALANAESDKGTVVTPPDINVADVVAKWDHDIPDVEICAKCDQMTHTPYDLEPTALCNTCAQEAVVDLIAAAKQLQQRVAELEGVARNAYDASGIGCECSQFTRCQCCCTMDELLEVLDKALSPKQEGGG